jgi:hypothetical protein
MDSYEKVDPEEIIEKLKRIIENLQRKKSTQNEEKLFNST